MRGAGRAGREGEGCHGGTAPPNSSSLGSWEWWRARGAGVGGDRSLGCWKGRSPVLKSPRSDQWGILVAATWRH